jgi:hypothetical protein
MRRHLIHVSGGIILGLGAIKCLSVLTDLLVPTLNFVESDDISDKFENPSVQTSSIHTLIPASMIVDSVGTLLLGIFLLWKGRKSAAANHARKSESKIQPWPPGRS